MNRAIIGELERFKKLDDLRTVGRLNEQQAQEYAMLAAELAPVLLRQLEQAEDGLRGLAERLTAVEAAHAPKIDIGQYTDKIEEQQAVIDAQHRLIRQQQKKINRLTESLEIAESRLKAIEDTSQSIPEEWQTPEGEHYQVVQLY